MRIQLLSDLHLERYVRAWEGLGEVQVDPRADAVVLAGDIAKGWASLQFAHQLAERSQLPVLWIPGNHEYYEQDYDELRLRFAQAELPGVHVLMERSVTLGDVRFLGATLWTDFALYQGAARLATREAAMNTGKIVINDFRVIRRGLELFSPQDSVREHTRARAFLERELRQPFEGRTVVVTHHAPCARSIHARFFADSRVLRSPVRLSGEREVWRINPCFASNLEKLVAHADVWVHGHMHNTADYHEGGCRVVANPRGYPRWSGGGELEFENPDYVPQLLIDV